MSNTRYFRQKDLFLGQDSFVFARICSMLNMCVQACHTFVFLREKLYEYALGYAQPDRAKIGGEICFCTCLWRNPKYC